jgi:hypothetical protein
MSEPSTVGPPWWCETCASWRHTMPCGRDECPVPERPEMSEQERAVLRGELLAAKADAEGRSPHTLRDAVLRVIHVLLAMTPEPPK